MTSGFSDSASPTGGEKIKLEKIKALLDSIYPFYPVLFILGSGIITVFFGMSGRKPVKLFIIILTACSIAAGIFINIYSYNLKGEFSNFLFNFSGLQVALTSMVLFSALNALLFLCLFNFRKDNLIKIILMFDLCILSFIFFIPSVNFIVMFSSLTFFITGVFQLVTSLNRGVFLSSMPEYTIKNNIIRFFLLSALSLLLMFLGFSLLFGATDLKTFSQVLESDFKNTSLIKTGFFIILLSAFLFSGFVPLHSPYMKMQKRIEKSSTSIIWLLYILAGIILLLKLKDIFFFFLDSDNKYIIIALLVVSAACVFAGNLGALKTTSIRRIFSFFVLSILGTSVLGFVQYGLGLFDGTTVLKYIISNCILLGVTYMPLMLVFYSLETNGDDSLERLRGFGKRNIYLSINMVIIMLSLSGLPGTYGYLSRMSLLSVFLSDYRTIIDQSGGNFISGLKISNMLVAFISWAFIAANIIRLIVVIYGKEITKKDIYATDLQSREVIENSGTVKSKTVQGSAFIPVFIYIYVTIFTLLIVLTGVAGLLEILGLKTLFSGFSILSLNF